jgi:hypothetical protein
VTINAIKKSQAEQFAGRVEAMRKPAALAGMILPLFLDTPKNTRSANSDWMVCQGDQRHADYELMLCRQFAHTSSTCRVELIRPGTHTKLSKRR